MNREIHLKKYIKKLDYTYTLGAFPTIELLKTHPEHTIKVLIHENMDSKQQKEIIFTLCKKYNIPYIISNKQVEKLRDKENCFVIGVLEKYSCKLDKNTSHIVLVNPSDMGNMGTIIRTSVGFGIENLVIIEPSVDIFSPKVIRASMGAIFRIHFHFYNSFEAYYQEYSDERKIYPFMLKGAMELQSLKRKKEEIFSLVFGNEASGLDDEFLQFGQSVFIKHCPTIDSLNLSMAVGIGLYEFCK